MTHKDIEIEASVNGSDHLFRISYALNWLDDLRGGLAWGVDWWSVDKVDNRPNLLGAFWAENLRADTICNAIMAENEDE